MNHTEYWNTRYKSGRGPGDGSTGRLHEFKLSTVQRIVDEYDIKSVVDYGCGDGSQLRGLRVDFYEGWDVSDIAIKKAIEFGYKNKSYRVAYPDILSFRDVAELVVSLDVVMHLPDADYWAYMNNIFAMATRHVLIYAPNLDAPGWDPKPHMFPRRFTDWIEENTTARLIEHIPNKYPAEKPGVQGTSFSEFFLYEV